MRARNPSRSTNLLSVLVLPSLLWITAWTAPPTVTPTPRPPVEQPAEQVVSHHNNDKPTPPPCWGNAVTFNTDSPKDRTIVAHSLERLLRTTHGAWLADQLCTILVDPDTAKPRSFIDVHFATELPHCNEAVGCFSPVDPHAPRYTVHVRIEPTDLDPSQTVFGEYPANAECAFIFAFREPESWMAQNLYHELLHIWFIHTFEGQKRRYRTGHGDVAKCEFDTDFLELLEAHARELAILEGRPPLKFVPYHPEE
jgi:hypothetical protein